MKVFLDANILLDCYKVSKASLDSIRALLILNTHARIQLITTEQVQNEVKRNREVTIKTALGEFEKETSANAMPAMVRELPESSQLTQLSQQYRKAKDAACRAIREQARLHTLPADSLIADVFKASIMVELDDKLYGQALRRHHLRNPPGKRDSMGDAVNWESCLQECDAGDTLYLISQDGDYFDPLNAGEPYPFLKDELETVKGAKLVTFRSLVDFFQKCFPAAQDAQDLGKELWVERLSHSRSYSETHRAVSEILKLKDHLTSVQLSTVADAFIINQQVFDICADSDVAELARFVHTRSSELHPNQAKAFYTAAYAGIHENTQD